MKTTHWFMVALVTLSSLPLVAQQAGASAQQSTSATAGNSSMTQSTSTDASASRSGKQVQAQGSAAGQGSMQMRPVNGELVGKLDSKNAKVGDPVVVKTVESARSTDGTEIPKGSRIIGHVTEVQAHSKTQQDAHMAIQFERAELKDGRSVPIRSVIQSVSPSQAALAAMANGNTDEQMYAGSHSPAGNMAGSTAGRAGALGGLGGAAGGVAGGAAGSAAGSVNSAAGSSLGGLGNAAGNVGATAGSISGTAAGAGSLGAHATAIPGVMLANDLSGATSSTLSATKNNVHLDSGTQVVLAVAAAASH